MIGVRVRLSERDLIRRAARETGLSMRDWSPKILVREAMRQVKGAKAGGLIRGKGPMKGSGG